MTIEIPIKSMSKIQKLATMEQLWLDLCQSDDISSPNWHNHVLAEREQAIAIGDSFFTDWKIAKAEMRAIVK